MASISQLAYHRDMARSSQPKESRHGVEFSSLDTELAEGTGVTKRALVDYLDAVASLMLPALRDRPLSVIRSTRGQEAFMQKNLPKHAPDWIEREAMWAESSHRNVDYAVCNDVRTLMWFANQRAVEYHVPLVCLGDLDAPTRPRDRPRPARGRRLLHRSKCGTSCSDGAHRSGPRCGGEGERSKRRACGRADRGSIERGCQRRHPCDRGSIGSPRPRRADHRLLEGRSRRTRVPRRHASGLNTIVSVYSPRLRPGAPVSWPVAGTTSTGSTRGT